MSLADYVGRMKDGQDKIYYVTAESFNAARNSPHLEVFRKKGIEVLLLSDRVDEWVVEPCHRIRRQAARLGRQGRPRSRRARGRGGEEGSASTKRASRSDLIEPIKASLGERVKDVRVTHRLTESPACLVADEHDVSGNLARMLKAAGQRAPASKPILEINPKHPVVLRLKNEDSHFDDWAAVLLDQALLAEGGQLDDPATFVKRINQLMLEMGAGNTAAAAG